MMCDVVIQVNADMCLHVGTIEETAQSIMIQPPTIPLIDQLITYLDPLPFHDIGFQIQHMSLGCAALCVRWGSYLATLIDVSAPLHPDLEPHHQRAQGAVSMLTNSEMRRMNIEISANFATLVRLYRERGWHALCTLLAKAYAHLPLSHRAVPKSHDALQYLAAAFESGTHILTQTPQSPDSRSLHQVPIQEADRCLANILMAQAWRNSLIEGIHAGTSPFEPVVPHQQRMLPATRQRLLREVTANMGSILFLFDFLFDPQERAHEWPTWPATATALANTRYGSAASGWSLTDQSAPVTLRQGKP